MTPKRLAFFALIGLVGGLVIGIAVGTDMSPAASGLLGAIIIFVVAATIGFLWGGLRIGE